MRLRDYDYRQSGVYFVTVCTHHHTCLFGRITDGEMRLNHLGKLVGAEWQHISKARTTVHLDAFVVMPNHFHGIVIINNGNDHAGPSFIPAVNGKRSGTLHSDSLGAVVGHFKAALSRRAKALTLDCSGRIWQRNYYEHVIRNEKSLNEIRKYIVENPARWEEDSLYEV